MDTNGRRIRSYLEALNAILERFSSAVRVLTRPVFGDTVNSIVKEIPRVFENGRSIQHYMSTETASTTTNTRPTGTIYLLASADNVIWEKTSAFRGYQQDILNAKRNGDEELVCKISSKLELEKEEYKVECKRRWHNFCAVFIYNNVHQHLP